MHESGRDERSAGKRLNKLVNLVYHNVPFYRNKMQEMDLSPDDIQTIEDIVKLPFTTKQDLRDNYPYGLQAAPASELYVCTLLREQPGILPLWDIRVVTCLYGPK